MHCDSLYEHKSAFGGMIWRGSRICRPFRSLIPCPRRRAAQLIEMSLTHPAWGCVRLSNQLNLASVSVSSTTIQNVLVKHGGASRYDRWLKLDEKRVGYPIELTGELVAFIEK